MCVHTGAPEAPAGGKPGLTIGIMGAPTPGAPDWESQREREKREKRERKERDGDETETGGGRK